MTLFMDGRLGTAVETVRVCKFRSYGADLVGVVMPSGEIRPIPSAQSLADALEGLACGRFGLDRTLDPIDRLELLAPVDRHEVWGACNQRTPPQGADVAGTDETARDGRFFKATASHVVAPGTELVVRNDASCTLPSFDLALWLDPQLRPIGLGLATDLYAGERDLDPGAYSTRARVWHRSCALGPAVLPIAELEAVTPIVLDCSLDRDGGELWSERVRATATPARIARTIAGLGRDSEFPDGVVLLTGLAIAPVLGQGLRHGDVVTVSAEPLGVLSNRVRVGL